MFWMRAYPLRGEVGGGWALLHPFVLPSTPFILHLQLSPLASPPLTPHPHNPPPPPTPHPEFIRNQQQTVMCIKGRYGA
jgi:hypothetical protein